MSGQEVSSLKPTCSVDIGIPCITIIRART